jgi:hypothetical protein
VPVLTELINDEDDDELSDKAFECLQEMGPKVLADLMKYLKLATGMVTGQFARSKSIIIDIYKKRERHIYLRSGIPNLRQVGP